MYSLFAETDEPSLFVNGMKDWKDVSKTLEVHERSNMHRMWTKTVLLVYLGNYADIRITMPVAVMNIVRSSIQ